MAERLSQINLALSSHKNNRLNLIRQRTKIDAQELKNIMFSEGCYNKYIQPIYQYIDSHKQIFTQHNLQDFDLEQQRKQAAKMVLSNLKEFKVDIKKNPEALPFTRFAVSSFDLGVNTKASVHQMLYTNSLLLFGNSQKHSEYYERATSAQDLGCFGLTEFHHGSYSKGIATTAHYNHAKKQFIISTHGTQGMKYWIGGAAQITNMCVLWAQLIVDGVSHGPHPFIFPLRCNKTHKVLPGIIIGDCGPKNGGNGIDNGYIMVQDVKIPVQNLLNRFGWIDAEGKYKSVTEDKDRRFGLFMTALSSGRGIITLGSNSFAINAITIALRYACSRKQFQNSTKDDQITIIDYPITQLRVIPLFANTILQTVAGTVLAKTYYQSEKKYLTDLKYGAQLHAVAAAAKSRYTSQVTRAIAECRTVLGGHGYSSYSSFNKLYHSSDVNGTWQGDNNVLLQQTTKFLIKIVGSKSKTEIVDLTFMQKDNKVNLQLIQQNLRNINNLEVLIQDLLQTKYKVATETIKNLGKSFDKENADYHLHPEIGNSLALSYADYFTFSINKSKLLSAKSVEVKNFLEKIIFLWGFNLLEKQRYGTHDFRKELQKQIIALSAELVDLSVVVTDIISPPSFVIGSPFAEFNGQGFKEYLNILYTNKDTFSRCHYYETLKNASIEDQ